MAKSSPKPPNTLQIEREGKVTTWTLHKRPVDGTRTEQEAYERGFRAFVSDFNQGIDRNGLPATVNYRKATDQKAYDLGYQDARAGGVTKER
jgi:hypothetical protein